MIKMLHHRKSKVMSNWFSNLIVALMFRNFRRKLYLTVFMVTEKNNYCCMIFISKS